MALQEHGRVHHFPVEDLTYDVLTILHEKSRALEAYDKYIDDARRDPDVAGLLREIREEDELHVERLQHHLARLLAHDVSGEGQGEGELPRSAETAIGAAAAATPATTTATPPAARVPRSTAPLDDDGDGDGDGQ